MTTPTWWDRIKAWLHEQTRPPGETLPEPAPTDEEIIAAWEPVTWVGDRGRVNPLLDLPLKPYAGMSKARVWEMFVDWVAESERDWILYDEQSWGPPNRSTIDAGTMQILSDDEADAAHAERLARWKENQEAPLRPGDPAAAVSVWLWRNGLRDQAVDVFAKIWRTVRAEQEGIPWTVESALEGFRMAAYRDWDDADHAEFAALFRQRYADPEIERGLHDLTD